MTLSAKEGGFTETFDVGNSDLTLKEGTHNHKGQMWLGRILKLSSLRGQEAANGESQEKSEFFCRQGKQL